MSFKDYGDDDDSGSDYVEFLVLVGFQEPQDSAGYQVTLESAVIQV